MVRTPSSFDSSGMRKGTWTPEEDTKLIAYVTRYGSWNWRHIPRFAGLARCGKSCRLRWLNYLRPNIKRGNYTEEEEEIIISLHHKMGNRWSVIATQLPGRTDNEIKNHWNTNLKKRFEKNTESNEKSKAKKSNNAESEQERDSVQNKGFFHVSSPITSKTCDCGPMSPQLSSSKFSSITSDCTTSASNETFDFADSHAEDVSENIWTESCLADITQIPMPDIGDEDFQGSYTTHAWPLHESPFSSSNENLVTENDQFAFLEATQLNPANIWTEPYLTDMSHVPNELPAPLVNESDEYFSRMLDANFWTQK